MKICRRDALKGFAVGAGGILLGKPFDLLEAIAAEGYSRREYNRVLLTTENKEPFKTSEIKKNENYIFFYPYHNIPVLLLNLNETIEPLKVESETGQFYIHPGGVGANKSIAAYVAICTHEFVRPNPSETLIKYYPPGETSFIYGGDNVICCCAHGSAYNPSAGGKVMQIPAEYPLTAVELEWDFNSDSLYAKALIGRNPPFKEIFKEDGEGKLVTENTPVKKLNDYTKKIVRC
ncbi:MAG: Rieske 2Fe-2S domain-containing protein [Nitrospinae bacterium]|nr:Rieske 2Fe-2S domain-containing protein [Nitrospinota bacterium]